MMIVFPLNIHDDYGVDQCEKINALDHKNVLPHTGYFKDEHNRLNLIAEYPLLPDLEVRVRSKKYFKKYFGINDVLKILSWIVDGLAYCHSQNVAHWDLHVRNIFYTEDNIIKIGNFLLDNKTPKIDKSNPANLRT